MSDSKRAVTYPTTHQYEQWSDRADELGYSSVSQYIQDMIEAGHKKFDATVKPDETNRELREQRNDLKDELDHARERIADLEEQLHQDERAAVREHVENNPGAEFGDIVQHVIDTAPERVNRHIDDLEGDALRAEDGEYYSADNDGDGEEVSGE
jgi:vacuolar-type H+-ATPase subunit I/STV1